MAASYGYYGYTYTRSEAWDYVDAIEGKVADRTDASDGKLLAGSSKVSGVRGYSKDKKISLIGNVAEGAGKAEAKVTLNTSDMSIMSFGCNCFDFDGHHMCRHCVAVAYTWLANEYYYTFDYGKHADITLGTVKPLGGLRFESDGITIQPFYDLQRCRYVVYWKK
jgi:hypothetical protein